MIEPDVSKRTKHFTGPPSPRNGMLRMGRDLFGVKAPDGQHAEMELLSQGQGRPE